MKYDLMFIGCGPSTIYSLLHLIKQGYKGPILVLEQGKPINERTRSEVFKGFGGAGTWSDYKISRDVTVGGSLGQLLDVEEYNKYSEIVVEYLNMFLDSPEKFTPASKYPTKTQLQFVTSDVLHVGTDRGLEVNKRIYEYLKQQPNINMVFSQEAINIYRALNGWSIETKDEIFSGNKVILATGQQDKLLPSLIEHLGLETKPNFIQMGIRVESDNSDGKWNDILKHNYDFKFRKTYELGQVRTFCCNSGNAHISKEEREFISYNGHADKEGHNNSVNFGIICEVKLDISKDGQIKICQNINRELPNNPYPLNDVKDLLKGCSFPNEVKEMLNDFIAEFRNEVDLDDAVFYIPEIKIINPRILRPLTGCIYPDLYSIGDVSISRGILQAAMSGIICMNDILGK